MKTLIQYKNNLEELAMTTFKEIQKLDTNLTIAFNDKVKSSTVKSFQIDMKNAENKLKKLNEDIKNFNSNFNSISSTLSNDIIRNYNNFIEKVEKIVDDNNNKYKLIQKKYSKLETIINDISSSDDNYDDNENELMLPKQQIVNLEYLIKNKNERINNIYQKTNLVNQYSNEVNSLTIQQEEELKDIEDNVLIVRDNAEKTANTVYKKSKIEQKYQINKTYLIILLIIIVFCLLIYSFKYGI